MPDLTLLLDLDPGAGLARIRARGATDRLERADLAFHTRVREGLRAEAERDPSWRVFDAVADEAELADAIWAAVAPLTARLAAGAPR